MATVDKVATVTDAVLRSNIRDRKRNVAVKAKRSVFHEGSAREAQPMFYVRHNKAGDPVSQDICEHGAPRGRCGAKHRGVEA